MDMTRVFTAILNLASSPNQTFSDSITPLVAAFLGDSVLLSLLGAIGSFGR